MGSTIKTSHAGSLPRPDDLLELNRRRAAGEDIDDAAYAQALQDATVEVVRRQREVNVIEHPQLVADRIERFAKIVGPDRVIAATDCGLGGRVHPQIAWAKLETLAKGAQLVAV